ncbi:glycosyltransferase [Algoriphagus sp.]|uniref:glycosyltransferase n=1 Tax=Algoriphagus sp. TaxID=1872435 RepID=UPI00326C90CE
MKTIICHSFPAWDTPYIKSTLELITRMAKSHRVIFLDYSYTLKDLIANKHAPKQALLGKAKGKRLISTDFGQVEVYNSRPMIPVNWVSNPLLFRVIMMLNAFIQSFTIQSILKTIDPEETELINAFNPVYGHFTAKYWQGLPASYYSYDNLAATHWSGKWGAIYEERFLAEVNRVIVSSHGLVEKFRGKHPNVKCVKNGVNLANFNQPTTEKTYSKTIGYLGAFDDRVDLELMQRVAQAYPDYAVEILGELKIPIKSLPTNLHFLGAKPQDQLNDLLKNWDAALIPFVKNEFTKNIYPLKINEYLAAGKPVISTDFADLEEFKGLIKVAQTQEEFMELIAKEIRYNNRVKISKRISFARQNSWEARTSLFLQALAS